MSTPAHVLHQENSRSRPQAVDGASEDLHPPSVVGRVKETLMAKGLTVREEADELRFAELSTGQNPGSPAPTA